MTDLDIIAGILEREGEGTPPYLDPDDAGGRTSWGISERQFPDAWIGGPPSKHQAENIYQSLYVSPFDALSDHGIDPRIRIACIDDAVLSGVSTAIKHLQLVMNHGLKVDGILGPKTAAMVREHIPDRLLQELAVARIIALCRLVQSRPADVSHLVGWVSRALSFLPEV